ncbi:MAG: A/G-specific adenine glycosylase [Bacteroidales bacterium]
MPDTSYLIPDLPPRFSALLLEWYDLNRRTLPWRGSRDPYVIWVSEVIFQQTRIDQGMEYFKRFIGRFPDVGSLASASEDEVLRLWQGLGYYSRARNLHQMAQWIQGELGGRLPEDFEGLLKMKGVGDYTASCIASICYGQPQAAVDGNVHRVLSRYLGDTTPIGSVSGKKHFKDLAQSLIAPARPGDFNEAMMDLGATVCTPRSPACSSCPLAGGCQALQLGLTGDLPIRSREQKKVRRTFNYLFVASANGLTIRKRQGKDVWQGLYELPLAEGELDGAALAGYWFSAYGLEVKDPFEVRRIRHVLSHQVIEIRFFRAASVSRDEDPPGGSSLLLAPEGEVNRYPFPQPLAEFLREELKNYGSTL